MDRPCGIGRVAMGARGIVGGPFKVIPTAIEISIRHHEAMEWVFWERQRRPRQPPNSLIDKDSGASEQGCRPMSAVLLIPT